MTKKCLSRRSLGEDGNTKLHKNQFDILILFFAPSRLCGIKISTAMRTKNHKNREIIVKNMEKQQKTDYFFTAPNPHFSVELFSDTRLRQRPPARHTAGVSIVELVYVEDWTAAGECCCRQKKPLKLVPVCFRQGSPRGETGRYTRFYWENPHFRAPLFVKANPILKIYDRF